MKLYVLGFVVLLLPTTAIADHPLPPVPAGGFLTLMAYDCTDQVYGQAGQCELRQDGQGVQYMILYQNDEVKIIRQITGDTAADYIELWVADDVGMT